MKRFSMMPRLAGISPWRWLLLSSRELRLVHPDISVGHEKVSAKVKKLKPAETTKFEGYLSHELVVSKI
jgi:hypothetical protein